MTRPSLAAGANLFTPCAAVPSEWLSAIDGWERTVRRLRVRVVLTSYYWGRLHECGCGPTYESVKDALDRAGFGGLVQTAVTLIAALQSASEIVQWEGVLTNWTASGCLNATVERRLAEEVVVAAWVLPSGKRLVAGAPLRDDEVVHLEGIEPDGRSELSETIQVACHAGADSFVEGLDVNDFADEPELAIEIAGARIPGIGSFELSRFQVLPELGPSLAAMDSSMRRRTFEAMAHLRLPKSERPRGLEEHAVRSGPGPNDAPIRSRRGVYLRVDLSKHGTGWRLHLWRGQDGVTFTHVAPKNAPLAIYG